MMITIIMIFVLVGHYATVVPIKKLLVVSLALDRTIILFLYLCLDIHIINFNDIFIETSKVNSTNYAVFEKY